MGTLLPIAGVSQALPTLAPVTAPVAFSGVAAANADALAMIVAGGVVAKTNEPSAYAIEMLSSATPWELKRGVSLCSEGGIGTWLKQAIGMAQIIKGVDGRSYEIDPRTFKFASYNEVAARIEMDRLYDMEPENECSVGLGPDGRYYVMSGDRRGTNWIGMLIKHMHPYNASSRPSFEDIFHISIGASSEISSKGDGWIEDTRYTKLADNICSYETIRKSKDGTIATERRVRLAMRSSEKDAGAGGFERYIDIPLESLKKLIGTGGRSIRITDADFIVGPKFNSKIQVELQPVFDSNGKLESVSMSVADGEQFKAWPFNIPVENAEALAMIVAGGVGAAVLRAGFGEDPRNVLDWLTADIETLKKELPIIIPSEATPQSLDILKNATTAELEEGSLYVASYEADLERVLRENVYEQTEYKIIQGFNGRYYAIQTEEMIFESYSIEGALINLRINYDANPNIEYSLGLGPNGKYYIIKGFAIGTYCIGVEILHLHPYGSTSTPSFLDIKALRIGARSKIFTKGDGYFEGSSYVKLGNRISLVDTVRLQGGETTSLRRALVTIGHSYADGKDMDVRFRSCVLEDIINGNDRSARRVEAYYYKGEDELVSRVAVELQPIYTAEGKMDRISVRIVDGEITQDAFNIWSEGFSLVTTRH